MSANLDMELPLGTHTYNISRMSAFDQMNVASECRDILVALAMLRQNRFKPEPPDKTSKKKGDAVKPMTDADYFRTAQFMIMSRAGLSFGAREQVVNLCLACVSRKERGGWQKVLAAPGVMQFDDIEIGDLSRILYAVFEHNKFLDFFSESPSDLGGQATTENGLD